MLNINLVVSIIINLNYHKRYEKFPPKKRVMANLDFKLTQIHFFLLSI